MLYDLGDKICRNAERRPNITYFIKHNKVSFLLSLLETNIPYICSKCTRERGPEYSRRRRISEDEDQTQEQSFAREFHAEVVWVWLGTTASVSPAAEHALYWSVCVIGQQKNVCLHCECLGCLFALTGCWNSFHCKMDFLSKILYSDCSATVWNIFEDLTLLYCSYTVPHDCSLLCLYCCSFKEIFYLV